MLTLRVVLLALRAFKRRPHAPRLAMLVAFGAASVFFYVLHLYVLKLLYLAARAPSLVSDSGQPALLRRNQGGVGCGRDADNGALHGGGGREVA